MRRYLLEALARDSRPRGGWSQPQFSVDRTEVRQFVACSITAPIKSSTGCRRCVHRPTEGPAQKDVTDRISTARCKGRSEIARASHSSEPCEIHDWIKKKRNRQQTSHRGNTSHGAHSGAGSRDCAVLFRTPAAKAATRYRIRRNIYRTSRAALPYARTCTHARTLARAHTRSAENV
jgi:hypothetical protein